MTSKSVRSQPRDASGKWVKAINKRLMKTRTVKRMQRRMIDNNRQLYLRNMGSYPTPRPKPTRRKRHATKPVVRKKFLWLF